MNQSEWDAILKHSSQNMDNLLKGKIIKNVTFNKELRYEISFADCQLENCIFKGIDLYNVDFANAIMKNVTIVNCINIKFESITNLKIIYSKRSVQNQNKITKTKPKPVKTKTKKKNPNAISPDTEVGIDAVKRSLRNRKPRI